MPRKRLASKLYLKFQITFLEYLNAILHQDRARVTQCHRYSVWECCWNVIENNGTFRVGLGKQPLEISEITTAAPGHHSHSIIAHRHCEERSDAAIHSSRNDRRPSLPRLTSIQLAKLRGCGVTR